MLKKTKHILIFVDECCCVTVLTRHGAMSENNEGLMGKRCAGDRGDVAEGD